MRAEVVARPVISMRNGCFGWEADILIGIAADDGSSWLIVDSKDLYSVLGVPRTAGRATIQAAYRTLMRRYHPDAGLEADTARAQQINEAYRVLGDPKKRRQYDALSQPKVTKTQPSRSAQHAAKKTFRPKKAPPSKQSFQRPAPSISESAVQWWIIAFIAALCAFLFVARR
jgi:DnaJ-domain-containing protein 1